VHTTLGGFQDHLANVGGGVLNTTQILDDLHEAARDFFGSGAYHIMLLGCFISFMFGLLLMGLSVSHEQALLLYKTLFSKIGNTETLFLCFYAIL
jgi:hypothetical protein